MKIKKIIVLFVLISQFFIGSSQNTFDVFNFSTRYGFPQSYTETYDADARELGTFLNFSIGIPITENTIWYNSLNHFYFNVDGDPAIPITQANPIKLNGFILRTGLYQKFGKGKGIQLLFAPRLMTDFENADSKSFQLGGVFLYENVFSRDLTMSFGAMYNQDFFGPYLVPLVNLNWILSDKWYIKGMLPITLKVNYMVTDNLTAGFSHFGMLTSYKLGGEHYKGDYIERQCIDLSLFVRQRITGNLFVEGKVGRTFGRGYTQYAEDQKIDFGIPLVTFGDERVAKNTAFEDGLFVDVGIVYAVDLSKR